MQPEDAVRQLRCVVNASLDQSGQSTAAMYAPTVERVAAEGTGADVTEFADRLCTDIRNGGYPEPAAADSYAERILQTRRTLTDGGKQ